MRTKFQGQNLPGNSLPRQLVYESKRNRTVIETVCGLCLAFYSRITIETCQTLRFGGGSFGRNFQVKNAVKIRQAKQL